MDILQIQGTLSYIAPPVWRRLAVPAGIKLGHLHRILQAAMAWTNTHLHAFHIHGATFGVPDPGFPDATRDDRNIRLEKVAGPGGTFVYEYDFGDGWEHEPKIEAVRSADPTIRYPRCARACPPEDCGGPPGDEELLAAFADPARPQHQAMRAWAGPELDPVYFDLAEVNQRLWRLK